MKRKDATACPSRYLTLAAILTITPITPAQADGGAPRREDGVIAIRGGGGDPEVRLGSAVADASRAGHLVSVLVYDFPEPIEDWRIDVGIDLA